MALFTSLNDEFESHSGQPQNSTTYVPAHYDIRSFHGTDLTVPRTMPDFRYWNASYFNGTSMITLSTPRSIIGRSISAHTMAEVDLQNQNLLDVQTIADIELYTLASGDEGWPIDPNVTVGKDPSLRYANTISVAIGGQTLTATGNEITDATRAATLTTASSGQMMDGRTNDSSFGIRRAATNLFRRGQCDATTDWTQSGTGTVTITTDATTPPPFSSQSIKAATGGTVSAQGVYASSATGLAKAAGVRVAGSIYFKGVSGQTYSVLIDIVNTDATTTLGTATPVTATGAWQQITPATVAVAAGKTGDKVRISVVTSTARAESFWVAHAMLEAVSSSLITVAPYVATSGGATATHAQGKIQGVATGVVTPTQGWFAARVRYGAPSTTKPYGNLFYYGSDSSQYIDVHYESGGYWYVGGSANAVNNSPISFNQGDLVTVIGTWTNNARTVGLSVNGAPFTSATTINGETITSSAFYIGQDYSNAATTIDSDVLWAAMGTGTLSDADAATINAFGNTDPASPSSLPGSATFLWKANDTSTLSGLSKTVSSAFRDNILTDFPNDGSTYYIELALPNFPAQAAGAHLDLANSFIDFSSDPGYAPAQTDSFAFNQSLTDLTGGGNIYFRINRNSLVKADWSNLQAIRFRLLSVGNMTFKAQSLRLYKSGDFNFPVTAIDTKRNSLRRSVPESSSASVESGGSQGIRYFSGTRPADVSEIIKFNSGHNPTSGNVNYFAMYFRHDPVTTNNIKVDFNAGDTGSIMRIYEKSNGVSYSTIAQTATAANILTQETDYFMKIDIKGNQARASVYQSRGAFFGPLVYTTDWITVVRTSRGLVGYDFNPYNYDFSIDYIKTSTASFGALESSTFSSINPLRSAALYPIASPPLDLSDQNYISSGDTTITSDPSFGDPAPSSKFVRTGASFFGGWETQDFLFIGDSHHLTISGKIYPQVTLNRSYRVVLIDKNDTVSWISYIPGLNAGKWNEFEIPVNATIAPANYRFALQGVGYYADTFWVQNLELNHDTIAWKVSPNSGGTWYNVYDAINDPYKSVNFSPVSYSAQVLDANPSSYYRLGDASTTAVDDISGANGTLGPNVTTGVAGAIKDSTNRAMSFPGNAGLNGTISFSDYPQHSFTNNRFAIEFWMKAADITSQIGVLRKAASSNWEYSIYASSPGTMTFNTYNLAGTAVYPQLAINYDTNWHHYVFQADGAWAYIYVDGDLINQSAKSANTMGDGTAPLLIGAATGAGTYFMNGLLDEIVLYPAPLSDDVINNHTRIGIAPKAMNALKVRAEALSDTAWIEGYKIYPRYGSYGHVAPNTAIVTPGANLSGTSAYTQDLRTFGQLIAPPITKDLRTTGQAVSPQTVDIRITGA